VVGLPLFSPWTDVDCSTSSADDGTAILLQRSPRSLVSYGMLHYGQVKMAHSLVSYGTLHHRQVTMAQGLVSYGTMHRG